ncbi:MAG: hypothetical protein HZY76_00160 [Anaerolineae bacterium]|nr:MAG: hypothetical protein HZY76_00160 [Anaerolineae bacterium]
MSIVLLLLRLIHIVAGAFWVGAGVAYFLYFEPSAKAGPARSKFMQELIGKYRYPIFMNVSSLLTILAGLGLYWASSGGLSAAWLTSGPGLGFTLGALAGLIAFGIGFIGIRPRPSAWAPWVRPSPRRRAAHGGTGRGTGPAGRRDPRLRAVGRAAAGHLPGADGGLPLFDLLTAYHAKKFNFSEKLNFFASSRRRDMKTQHTLAILLLVVSLALAGCGDEGARPTRFSACAPAWRTAAWPSSAWAGPSTASSTRSWP